MKKTRSLKKCNQGNVTREIIASEITIQNRKWTTVLTGLQITLIFATNISAFSIILCSWVILILISRKEKFYPWKAQCL